MYTEYIKIVHLQSDDLSREGIKLWITDILFDHTRTWRSSLDEWSALCRGHFRDSTDMKDNAHQAYTQSSQEGEYGMMIRTAKWYSGTLGGPEVSWHLSYRWGKTPEKASLRKPVPTGDRTRARCVTRAHATTCSTAVDGFIIIIYINKNVNVRLYVAGNLRKFFTDRLEILTQHSIRIREC